MYNHGLETGHWKEIVDLVRGLDRKKTDMATSEKSGIEPEMIAQVIRGKKKFFCAS